MRQRFFRRTSANWLTLSVTLLGLLLLSCGKKPAKSAEADPSAREEQAGALAAEAEDTTPLEPAPVPHGVFVRARIKNPGALLSSIGDAASSPLDLRRLLAEADARVRRMFERVVDIDAPIEAIVALHPVSEKEPMAVWSVSARGVRSALAGLDAEGIDTRQGPEGMHYFELSGDQCALGRSLGRSPARIVCADRAESLDSLVAYALRGFPTEPLSESEVALRLIAEPLQKQYGKKLRGLRLLAGVAARQVHRDNPRFDAAASDAILGLTDELIAVGEDVRGLSFDLWDRDGAFESEVVLEFAGSTSWLAGTAREWVKAQGSAPALALRLPADATFAGYFRQPPKKQCERLARVLGELGAGGLESEGVSRTTADKLARALTLTFAADRTVVYAGGLLTAPGAKAEKRPVWRLIGVDQERKAVLEILDNFAAVLSDKQLDKLDIEPGHRPELARKNLSLGRGLSAVVYEWRLPETAVDALERGSEELSKEGVPAAGAASMRELERGYLAVMGSGDATWLTLAPDREGLIESLGKVGADVPRLGSSPDYARLVETPALVASGIRLAGLVDQVGPILSLETRNDAAGALATAPHRGAVPVTSFLSVSAGTATEIRLRTHIPDEFVTDTAALILALSAQPAGDTR